MTAFAGIDLPSLILGVFIGAPLGLAVMAVAALGGRSDDRLEMMDTERWRSEPLTSDELARRRAQR